MPTYPVIFDFNRPIGNAGVVLVGTREDKICRKGTQESTKVRRLTSNEDGNRMGSIHEDKSMPYPFGVLPITSSVGKGARNIGLLSAEDRKNIIILSPMFLKKCQKVLKIAFLI